VPAPAPAPGGAAPAPAPAPAPPIEPLADLPPAPTPASPPETIESGDLEEPPARAAEPLAGPDQPPASPAGDARVAEYERGLELLRDQRPAEAEAAFARFVAAEPRSELADNAWFWIGESRLVRDDAAGALVAFRTAVESYPDGNKTPDALFKLGYCLDVGGDRARAAEVWRELVRRFPATVAAERARERLGD
jgi:tol-pal system protein YbgF